MTNARREPRRPQRQPDQRRVPAAREHARASRGSARSSPGRRSRTWPTCSRRTCRSSTATSATSTSARPGSPAARRRRPRQPDTRSVPGTTATGRPPPSTTQAFQTFFARLAAAGITKDNTLFVFGAEENDQFDGANVGRAIQPTPGRTRITSCVLQPPQRIATPRARSARSTRTCPACSRPRRGTRRRSRSSRRAPRSTSPAGRARPTPPFGSSSATSAR